MSRDRGQRRNHESGRQRGHSGSRSGSRSVLVQLAEGVTLQPGGTDESCVLAGPNGKVQLNNGATIILRLCDGSRTSDEIIAEVMRTSPGETLASDVAEFLEVALARGWIVAT